MNCTKNVDVYTITSIRVEVINQLGYANAATTMLENECDANFWQNKISARRGNLGSLDISYAKNVIEYIRKNN